MTLRVLHVVPAFYPATYFGGPIYSLYGLCNALAALPGVDVRVLTSDSAGSRASQRLRITHNPQHLAPGYEVHYCRKLWGASVAPGQFLRMPRMVDWADVVHVTAAYSPSTIPALAACRALGKPLVWSPRGAFQRWRSTTRSKLKDAWDSLCRSLLAKSSTVLHVTSPEEAEATRIRMPGIAVAVVPNGVDVVEASASRLWRPGGTLRLLYLGRLHPIKGIENLLRALAALRGFPFTLRVCGSGDAAYARSLARLAGSLSIQERVSFAGEIGPRDKAGEFDTADVCVLPSHSENFGMTIAESLAHGVPVIASRGTPWASVEDQGCGLWVDNDPDALSSAIRALANQDLRAMGERGRTWMAKDFTWNAVATRMRDCYASLAPGG